MRTREQILAEIRAVKTNPENYNEVVIRADPYTLVAERMLEKMPDTEVFKGMSFKQVRAYCKDPIMTAFYNSQKEPEKAFGKDTQELQTFYETLHELFPGAMNVLEAINDRWDDEALYHTWSTPDGHIAHVDVTEEVHGTLESEGLKLEYRYYENKPSKYGTSLAPNFIHSLDAFCIRHVIENADFEVTHVHDDYQCHPNNMSKVRELYLDALRIIAKGSYLEDYCEQDFQLNRAPFLEGLQHSSYALC